jgi:glycine hydroxymethyltransferase
MKRVLQNELLKKFDPEVFELLHREHQRQKDTIGLIASENVVSPLSACLEGSLFTNKNTEGYPGRRFVGGCEYCDAIEELAITRLKELFGCDHANIQGATATISNIAIFVSLLEAGDTVLSMNLSHGGHLSHGASFHFSGSNYQVVQYGVSEKDELIDMEEIKRLAKEHRPRMIVCGASSYPRLIDYKGFSEIARGIGAYLWADCAHEIGLIAAKVIPSPVPYADVVSFSTQKTLRGPRGCGVILCRETIREKIDRGVFPKIQGGPKMDMIAARAVLFKECFGEEFRAYAKQVVLNAKALANGCIDEGMRLITGGTDTHMVLVDVTRYVPSGQKAEDVLNSIGIVTNKNMIPFDKLPGHITSGLRIGSPLMTTRGAKEEEMYRIGKMIGKALRAIRILRHLEKLSNR